MEHRRIGELSVSVVGLGCNQLGIGSCDEKKSEAVILDALDAGINFFDTSDEYGRNYDDASDLTGWGRSEEILGRVLRSRRDEVVIASKFGPPGPITDDPASVLFPQARSEASARGVALAVEESLRRLQTDRIDLFQLHFPDPRFPIEETLGALNDLVQAGKVREIGCCNFSAAQLQNAKRSADDHDFRRFASVQNAFSVLQRAPRKEVIPTCDELGIGFIPYWPLASGVLTGKYQRAKPTPDGSRLAEQVDDATRSKILSDRTFTRIEALEAFAERAGHSLLDLAFSWLLGHRSVSTVIAGASRPGQPTTNASAANWKMSTDEIEEIFQIVDAV
jgi:aryl-alcohol dehydrogenase-like predicted oxidoreductase